jgi:hypothetical protein
MKRKRISLILHNSLMNQREKYIELRTGGARKGIIWWKTADGH